jgi:hypothetical protein
MRSFEKLLEPSGLEELEGIAEALGLQDSGYKVTLAGNIMHSAK